jgi:p38 MAP kinase
MAEFVRAQIFGTTFEITSRYTDLQPVGMGAFGLVWYGDVLPPANAPLVDNVLTRCPSPLPRE